MQCWVEDQKGEVTRSQIICGYATSQAEGNDIHVIRESAVTHVKKGEFS